MAELRTDPLTGWRTYVVGSRQGRPNLPTSGCPFCPGGLEAPDPYDVRWFKNRWPAMPDDRCEVVLYTPEHDATFWSLGVEGAVLLFPDGTINFINAWVHGLDLTVLRSDKPYTLGGLAYGLFGVTLIGFLVGALFACCYNLADKCPCCLKSALNSPRRKSPKTSKK